MVELSCLSVKQLLGDDDKIPVMLKTILKVGHQISAWGTSLKVEIMMLSTFSCNFGENRGLQSLQSCPRTMELQISMVSDLIVEPQNTNTSF